MMLSHVSRNPGLLAFQWDLSTAPRAFLTVARGALPSCLTGRTHCSETSSAVTPLRISAGTFEQCSVFGTCYILGSSPQWW